jgi:uncharacterized protein (DUF1697 family)
VTGARASGGGAKAAPARHVALLRGVNVGGRNRLPMKELAAIVADAGAREVATYIQSGNVIFTAAAGVAARLPGLVATALERRFGFRSPVIVRTAAELAEVGAKNPFLRAGAELDELHVAFLAEPPERARAAALDPDRSPGDSFALRGRDLYLRLGNGAGKTKLTNDYLDRTLATVSTLRNWRTVTALLALARGGGTG